MGPADQLDGLRRWLERCREPIPAKDERYPHLFPSFPGCDIDRGLHTTLVFSDRNTRQLPERPLRALANRSGAEPIVEAVDLYADEIGALAEENRVDIILVARPDQLQDTRKRRRGPRARRKSRTGSDSSALAVWDRSVPVMTSMATPKGRLDVVEVQRGLTPRAASAFVDECRRARASV